MGAKGPRATKSALRPRALVSSHGQRCHHNLAHDSPHDPAHDSPHDPAHDPARDPARDPAKGGWAVWRWPCGGHMTCHVTVKDNPLRVTIDGKTQKKGPVRDRSTRDRANVNIINNRTPEHYNTGIMIGRIPFGLILKRLLRILTRLILINIEKKILLVLRLR